MLYKNTLLTMYRVMRRKNRKQKPRMALSHLHCINNNNNNNQESVLA